MAGIWAQESTSYDVHKEIALYGNLKQDDIRLIGDADGDGDTNDYQDLVAVANTLGGPNYMNTV
ncbi:MAG: hypothetical protein QHH26_05225 [Armatimonadota bacterium]|nr:hypothetical protein [Armatimonadota bacterium]